MPLTVGPIAVMAVALIGAIVGLLWIRRIVRGEPDPKSFRSSTRPPSDYLPAAGVITAVGLVGLVLFLVMTR